MYSREELKEVYAKFRLDDFKLQDLLELKGESSIEEAKELVKGHVERINDDKQMIESFFAKFFKEKKYPTLALYAIDQVIQSHKFNLPEMAQGN